MVAIASYLQVQDSTVYAEVRCKMLALNGVSGKKTMRFFTRYDLLRNNKEVVYRIDIDIVLVGHV